MCVEKIASICFRTLCKSWHGTTSRCWLDLLRISAILFLYAAVVVFARSWFDRQDLVLAVIGEMFEEPNVVGIGMAIRSREDLLSVWNEDNSNDKVCMCIRLRGRSVQQQRIVEQQSCPNDDLSRCPRVVLVLC